jgi:hypothetical protein
MGTMLYGRQVFALFGVERAIEKHSDLADQVIHRPEDFMTHNGQELFLLMKCGGHLACRLSCTTLTYPAGNLYL